MGDTKIQWTEKTWNPVRGCSVVSEGCRNCYAMTFAARFAKDGEPYDGLAYRNGSGAHWTGKLRFVAEHLEDPLRWRKPARIFVNSMSDLFHENVETQWLNDIFGIMALAHWHTFQILTKRPDRALAYISQGSHGVIEQFQQIQQGGGIGPRSMFRALDIKRRDGIGWQWPLPNVWLGTSVEDQKTADERIPLLLQTPAAIRWISAEPLLGPINLSAFMGVTPNITGEREAQFSVIDWVVVGGESGPRARGFDLAWARSLVAQCRAANVPIFIKQLGAHPGERKPAEGPQGVAAALANVQKPHPQRTWFRGDWTLVSHGDVSEWVRTIKINDKKGGDINEWPEDLRVREFPNEPVSL